MSGGGRGGGVATSGVSCGQVGRQVCGNELGLVLVRKLFPLNQLYI